MNNGENITYLGTSALIRLPGDVVVTNDCNMTELSRTYAIRKDRRNDAVNNLVEGKRAEGFSNLYLFNPPVERRTETHCFFDCVFYGVLSVSEGGRSTTAETLDRTSNFIEFLSTAELIYTAKVPVHCYKYTIPVSSDDRAATRAIALPASIPVTNNLNGSIVPFSPTSFYWEHYDLQRQNFGKYDEVREYWALRRKLT